MIARSSHIPLRASLSFSLSLVPPRPPRSQAAAERAQLVDALAKATLHAERAAAAVGAAAAAAGGARTALDAAAAELSGAHAALDEPASPLAPQWNSLRALPAEPPAAEMAAPGFDVAQWQLRQALATTAADRVELAPQLAEQHDRVRREAPRVRARARARTRQSPPPAFMRVSMPMRVWRCGCSARAVARAHCRPSFSRPVQ